MTHRYTYVLTLPVVFFFNQINHIERPLHSDKKLILFVCFIEYMELREWQVEVAEYTKQEERGKVTDRWICMLLQNLPLSSKYHYDIWWVITHSPKAKLFKSCGNGVDTKQWDND